MVDTFEQEMLNEGYVYRVDFTSLYTLNITSQYFMYERDAKTFYDSLDPFCDAETTHFVNGGWVHI